MAPQSTAGTKGLIVYSTLTGNTEKVARGVCSSLNSRPDFDVSVVSVDSDPDVSAVDWIIVGFWANRGTADDKTLAFLQKTNGKRIGFMGTMGAYRDSDHARDIDARVRAAIAEQNTVLGGFLCQGKIDPKITERFRSLPAGHAHGMTPEREQRHKDASLHPDERDIEDAVAAVFAMLEIPAEV